VADGVGEWAVRFKINPRVFADQLMAGAKDVLEASGGQAEDSDQTEDACPTAVGQVGANTAQSLAFRALEHGYNTSTAWGSATCCIAALSATERELGIANFGDSGARLVRFGPDGVPQIVERTLEQQHSFNCPYQLSRVPCESEYAVVRERGFGSLIDAISDAGEPDTTSMAALYAFDVKEGDLLILGSDGLWDNLFEYELLELIEQAATLASFGDSDSSCAEDDALLSKLGFSSRRAARRRALTIDPDDLARSIARKTYSRSSTVFGKTPFADSAEKSGFHHRGGKMDDITVVVAWVLRR